MSDNVRTVQMALIVPGDDQNGEFHFAMQPRFNPGRTVHFALTPQDAEGLSRALEAYLEAVRAAK